MVQGRQLGSTGESVIWYRGVSQVVPGGQLTGTGCASRMVTGAREQLIFMDVADPLNTPLSIYDAVAN